MDSLPLDHGCYHRSTDRRSGIIKPNHPCTGAKSVIVALALRIYALYNKSRKVLTFIVACLALTAGSMLGIAGTVMRTEEGKRHDLYSLPERLPDVHCLATFANFGPRTELRMCIPLNLNGIFKFFWIPLLVNEALLASLAMAKWFESPGSHGVQAAAVGEMVKDSTIYFIGYE